MNNLYIQLSFKKLIILMNLNNKYTKFFTFVLASGVFASSAFAGPCGGSKNKPEWNALVPKLVKKIFL